jgi:cysteinyl-tRNA synthetase
MRIPRLALLGALLATGLGAQERVGFPVSDWVYRLQPKDGQSCEDHWAEIDATDTQVAVIDPNCGGDAPMTMQQLLPLCTRPDGTPRMVLAYLSVGEAEDYRFYWRPGYTPEVTSNGAVTPGSPSWLGPRNPDWPDNVLVKFWDPAWQEILIDGPPLGEGGAKVPSAIDRIVSTGFDGVYLDLVDNYKHWEAERPSAKQEMVDLIQAIRDGARARFTKTVGPGSPHPGFVVLVQNGLELFFDAEVKTQLRAAVSGIGVEAFSFDAHDVATPDEVQDFMAGRMTALRQDEYVVLTIDYAKVEANRVAAATYSRSLGFLPWIGEVDLDAVHPQPQVSPDSTDIIYGDTVGTETAPETIDPDEVEYGSEDRPPDDLEFDDDDDPGAGADPGGIDDIDDLDEDGREDIAPGEWRRRRRRRPPPPECDGDKPGILPVIAAATVGGAIGLAAAPIAGVVGLVAGGAVGELYRLAIAKKDCDQRDRLAYFIDGPPRMRRHRRRIYRGDPGDAEDLREAFRAVQEAIEAGDEDAQQEAWERLRALQREIARQRGR